MRNRKTMTRAKAQRLIAGTTDPEVIRPLLKHTNSHIRVYAGHKLDQLENGGQLVASVRALKFVLGLVESGDFSAVSKALLKLKRSEASRKAAATRRAKKAAEQKAA